MRASSFLAAGMVAAAVIVAGTMPARAGDTINLNIAAKDTSNTTTLKLGGTGSDADIFDVRGGRGGYGRGGYGYGRGGYRGYYGYRGGYGVGYYGLGFYRPYYVGGYAPIYRPYYYYGSGPVIYTYPSLYYTPISTTVVATPTDNLSIGNHSAAENLNVAPRAIVPQPNGAPTYPYDGGPRQPIPMPKATDGAPAPTGGSPTPNLPLEGRQVSLPTQKASNLTYNAYGEQKRTPAVDRTTVVSLPR